jgi:hypothetical protein
LNFAFCECWSLESLCIPASVQLIGENCFAGCEGLVSVTFEQPSMLEIVKEMAFSSCKSLTRISIPASIQQIGSRCFHCCESLASVTFQSPSNLVLLWELGDLILPSIDIPDSVEVIIGMTTASTPGSMVVSFGSESKLSAVCPRRYRKHRTGAFVRYSEATLRRFRVNVDDFTQGAAAQVW